MDAAFTRNDVRDEILSAFGAESAIFWRTPPRFEEADHELNAWRGLPWTEVEFATNRIAFSFCLFDRDELLYYLPGLMLSALRHGAPGAEYGAIMSVVRELNNSARNNLSQAQLQAIRRFRICARLEWQRWYWSE